MFPKALIPPPKPGIKHGFQDQRFVKEKMAKKEQKIGRAI